MVVASASEPEIVEAFPEGLIAQILDGKVLRADRIAACRQRLLDGPALDAHALADAMVREVLGPYAAVR